MRVVVVSENMGAPLDEGIRKFATSLVGGLSAHCDAYGIATESGPHDDPQIAFAPGGKFFTGRALGAALRAVAPDAIVYVPSASGTVFSFLRARMLKRAAPGAHVSMVLTQRRTHSWEVRRFLPKLAPDALFCQSHDAMRYLRSVGLQPMFLPSGVDLDRFYAVPPERKLDAREELGLPFGEYLVLHAGHVRKGRNAELLAKLNRVGRGVMLAGSSMGRDMRLAAELAASGVIVIDRYLEDVEKLYQAVDCYVFPTREDDNAIEMPLGVLEAMACNLPVAAHPYGGLPMAFSPVDGLMYAETDEGLIEAISKLKDAPVATRERVKDCSWRRVAERVLQAVQVKGNAGAIAGAV